MSALGLVIFFGCDSKAPLPYKTSLVELFPLAEIQQETSGIDFGAPQARIDLLGGWSTPQTTKRGVAYSWTTGDVASFRLHLLDIRPRQFVLTGWPYRFPGAPPQIVTVELNGVAIDTIQMLTEQRIGDYRISVPAAAQKLGVNRVDLRYAYARRPIDVNPESLDVRPLAAAWASFRIENARAHGSPRTERSGDSTQLILPSSTAISYYFNLPDGAVLTLDDISPRVASGVSREEIESALTIELQLAGNPDKVVLDPSTSRDSGEYRLRLPPSPQGPVRLSLIATPNTSAQPVVGIRLTNPSVQSERPLIDDHILFDPLLQSNTPISERHEKPNILIYLVDTLRADHLGCYGYDKPTSPNIDSFSKSATLFRNPIAQASWTRSAVASVLTGLYAPTHGTIKRLDTLSESVRLLPEVLKNLGYQTAAVVTNGNISSQFGFNRGFDTYRQLKEQPDNPENHQLSDSVNAAAFEWLRLRSTEPFLLYLHTTDPHNPYMPRSPHREKLAPMVADTTVGSLRKLTALKNTKETPSPDLLRDITALYDAEIAFNDAEFGHLIEKLKELDLYDQTMIIFLSDHGEEFLDHGYWEHGNSLFNEQIHIPLIIKFPNGLGKGTNVDSVVRQIDILPTILDYLGQPIPPRLQGSSLLPWLLPSGNGPTAATEPMKATLSHVSIDKRDMMSLILSEKKLIQTAQDFSFARRDRPHVELFDLRHDWSEQENIADRQPVWAGYLLTLLKYQEQFGGKKASAKEAEIDEGLRRRLQALGYLD